MQTVEDKTVISGLCWYASDQYRLPITFGGVGGDQSNRRLGHNGPPRTAREMEFVTGVES